MHNHQHQMESLYELEHEVDVLMNEHRLDDGRSLWAALVESAIKHDGAGCDGLLMTTAERITEKLLGEMNVNQLT